MRLGNFDALESFEVKDGGDLGTGLRATTMDTHDRVADFYFAAVNFSERDTAQIIRVIQVRDERLEFLAGMRARRRDPGDDRFEERLHARARFLHIELGEAFFGAGVNNRKIQLLVGRVQRQK